MSIHGFPILLMVAGSLGMLATGIKSRSDIDSWIGLLFFITALLNLTSETESVFVYMRLAVAFCIVIAVIIRVKRKFVAQPER